jgi:hypothetical protein
LILKFVVLFCLNQNLRIFRIKTKSTTNNFDFDFILSILIQTNKWWASGRVEMCPNLRTVPPAYPPYDLVPERVPFDTSAWFDPSTSSGHRKLTNRSVQVGSPTAQCRPAQGTCSSLSLSKRTSIGILYFLDIPYFSSDSK